MRDTADLAACSQTCTTTSRIDLNYDVGEDLNYDVGEDGKRFPMLKADRPSSSVQLTVVLNWFAKPHGGRP